MKLGYYFFPRKGVFCLSKTYGCPFWVCPTGGHVPQVGVALKYSHLTECEAMDAPSDGHVSYCIIVVRICRGTKLFIASHLRSATQP